MRNPRFAYVNTNAVRFGFQYTREVLRFRWDADASLRSGASAMEVASVLRPVLATRFPTVFADLERAVRMPVQNGVSGSGHSGMSLSDDISYIIAHYIPTITSN